MSETSQTPQRIVIVGAGLAGAAAAEELRKQGYAGSLVVVGAERHLPYDRPPLSKEVLLGSKTVDETALHDEAWWGEREVDLRLGVQVSALDRERQVVVTPAGELGYDALVLATGSEPRRLPVDGAVTLRTRDDAEALRARLLERPRVLVVGGGWIGLEAAAAARQADCEVTVVEPQDQPLQSVMGRRIGAAFADLHRQHDVDLRLGRSFEGTVPGDVDLVLVAIGAAPRLSLAQDAGLDVDGGVLVDAELRTSDPRVFAVGDIAAHDHPRLGRLRVEHWDNAIEQGRTAARNVLGAGMAYDRLPYFFTDQYDLGMEYVGHVPRPLVDQVAVRGDLEGREAVVVWHDHGRVVAGMHLNVWDSTDHLRALVGRTLDLERFVDPAVELAELSGVG